MIASLLKISVERLLLKSGLLYYRKRTFLERDHTFFPKYHEFCTIILAIFFTNALASENQHQ
jgi:hypothetical protein